MASNAPPTLDELGRDLLQVSPCRRILSLLSPFLLAAAFIAFALSGKWVIAVVCVALLTFLTYGSISHDLVHRSLGLPSRANDCLLTLIELLMLRSGRAYRLAHLNHHARFPDPVNDPEGRAAHGTLGEALGSGPFFFFRLWWWAVSRHPRHRPRLLLEGGLILALVVGAVVSALLGWSQLPLAYVVLAYVGTWVIPLVTSYIPHAPNECSELTQTRRFRGWVIRLIALDHLYHLEHHLYPAVPHHRWNELARRLDPFLDRVGVPVVGIER